MTRDPQEGSLQNELLSDVAIACRLRRWWITEAAAILSRTGLDLLWDEATLERVGSELVVLLPEDTVPDPAATDAMQRSVGAVTEGQVSEVSWRFDPKRARRIWNRHTETDVFTIEDPVAFQYDDVVADLNGAIPSDTTKGARKVLDELRLAGASRDWLWLAAPSETTRRAVGSTPGAAYALHTAINTVQRARNKPRFHLLTDPAPIPWRIQTGRAQ